MHDSERAFSEESAKSGSEEVKALLLKISDLKPEPSFYQDVALFTQSCIPPHHSR